MPFRLLTRSLSFMGRAVRVEQVCFKGETVGGDAVFVEEGRADDGLLLLVVDASGHGPSAYRLVSHLQGRLLTRPESHNKTPSDLVRWLNGRLAGHPEPTDEQLEEGFFEGLVLLLPAVPGDSVRGLRAGFREVHAGRPGAAWRVVLPTSHLPLGLPGPLADDPCALDPGEWLLAFTDGVHEATPPHTWSFFGNTALVPFLRTQPEDLDVAGLFANLWLALANHVGDAWPTDDVTLVGYCR